MKKFLVVYNMKSGFEFNPTLTIESLKRSTDYVPIETVDAKDLEDLYEILNLNHPAYFLEQLTKYAENNNFPSRHTSMLVGDVAIEYCENEQKYFQCSRWDWVEFK